MWKKIKTHPWWTVIAVVLIAAVVVGLGWLTLNAVLGYLGVATWSRRLWPRLVGAGATALLGVVLIVLKALIH